jgi:rhamnulokinase
MAQRNVAAVDLGAESGRVVLARFDGTKLELEEVHRFPTLLRELDGMLRWDVEDLWRGLRDGLARAGEAAGRVDAVGVDTWGLDYGRLDAGGDLLGDPGCYRDPRTEAMLAEAIRLVGRERLYEATGIQILQINTVFQLMDDARAGRLDAAERLLLMPDLFHHRLGGDPVSEYTIASTTGAYDMGAGEWALGLLEELGVPAGPLPDVVPAGTDTGKVSLDGDAWRDARVIAPASHDTGSAVVSVPFTDPGAAYISSGTWSLIGLETPGPVITEAAMRANLTNEGGAYGTIRLLRNGAGLWLLQESRRQWARDGRDYSYAELVELAAAEPPGVSVVNPDHQEFVAPGDMPARIRAHCERAGEPVPGTDAALARCIFDSLALGYRRTFDDLATVTGDPVPAVHIVGGGSRNELLNQLVADTAGLPVIAGPAEATALGNALVQLIALGELDGLEQARELVRGGAGGAVKRFEPSGDDRVARRYQAFRERVAADLDAAGLAG